jgi:CRISPR-associated endonuclease/helicase Cas3
MYDAADDAEVWAHTPPNEGGEAHLLCDHLRETADLAEHFAAKFGAAAFGRAAGLLHDIGKASDGFQRYLVRCHQARLNGTAPPSRSVDHKLAGVSAALSIAHTGRILAIPILGHHGGIPDAGAMEERLDKGQSTEMLPELLSRMQHVLGSFEEAGLTSPRQAMDSLALDLFIRMLFSALVDADFLDTEGHLTPDKSGKRGGYSASATLWKRFEHKQARFQAEAADTKVNRLRRGIYEACVRCAEKDQGVFRLTVPTGGGKTRSAMAFALKHAVRHKLDRVIVAIPYTSIIDQNAEEYRKILGRRNVLEHHSAADWPDTDGYSEAQVRAELASENWDMPIIVTTTVQFFESLFSNKPSKCRKLHNIAKSVIILDEVQTLPIGMLQPILDMLKELVAYYGVTLVLSTATQPALSGDSPYVSGFSSVTEIVPDAEKYFAALKRVEYRVEPDSWPWERVADEMRGHHQALCVVNSRRDALDLFNLLDDPAAFYLSTLMCPAHRRDVLKRIKRRLHLKQQCRVVSTQLVEAGVDLDFPYVMRALGPLDRIVQAAGRCNREGRMLPDLGKVTIFVPLQGHAPRGNYSIEMQVAETCIAERGARLADPDSIESYFADVYMTVRKTGLDAKGVNASRAAGNFETTARNAKLIQDDTLPLVVRCDLGHVGKLLSDIKRAGYANRHQWRELQQYTVNVYRSEYARYASDGLVEEVVSGINVWRGKYDQKTGLSGAMLDPSDLVWD